MSLKVVFAGTPDFAVPTLQALIESTHQVIAVLTQPDRHSGRGQHTHRSPVKKCAQAHDIAVLQPITLKDDEIQQALAELNADVMVVVAYGLILPSKVLAIPTFGCLNVHASILPRWRGAAPIHHAILQGDATSGVTIMQMDAGLDTGDMLAKKEITLPTDVTTASLHDDLASFGATLLLKVLEDVEQAQLKPIKQDDSLATYANKISKQDANINWSQSAHQVNAMVRAYNAWPVAFTHINDQLLRIWRADVIEQATNAAPGTIIAENKDSVDVATSEGVLRLLEVQLPGAKRMLMQDVLNSKKDWFTQGTVLC